MKGLYFFSQVQSCVVISAFKYRNGLQYLSSRITRSFSGGDEKKPISDSLCNALPHKFVFHPDVQLHKSK